MNKISQDFGLDVLSSPVNIRNMFARQRHKLRNIVKVYRYYNLLSKRLFYSYINSWLYLT